MLAEEDALVELDPALGRPPRQEVLLELEVVDGVEGQHEEAHCAALAAVSRAASRSWRRVRGTVRTVPFLHLVPQSALRVAHLPAALLLQPALGERGLYPVLLVRRLRPLRRQAPAGASAGRRSEETEQRQRLTHQVLSRLPRRLLRLGGLLLRDGPAERGRGRRRRRVEQERRRRLHVVRVRLEHPARQQAGALALGAGTDSRALGVRESLGLCSHGQRAAVDLREHRRQPVELHRVVRHRGREHGPLLRFAPQLREERPRRSGAGSPTSSKLQRWMSCRSLAQLGQSA